MPPPAPPPWEVLHLAARLLNPSTLAAAACVSKSWNAVMSSDHLWRRLCLSHYPSSLNLSSSLSARQLFSLFHTSRRRLCRRAVPTITLHNLIFVVDVIRDATPIVSIVKDGAELCQDAMFRFDVEIGGGTPTAVGNGEEVRVMWTVVMKGWTGAFTMMDCVGEGRVVGGRGRWFSEVLPGPTCCAAGVAWGRVVAEVGVGMEAEEGRLSLGLIYDMGCRYVGVEDALLYLQPFLIGM